MSEVKVVCPKCNHGIVMEYDPKTQSVKRFECDLCYGAGMCYSYWADAYIQAVYDNFKKRG